jgi:nicotinate-nucleotide adenylyltransferase
MTVETKPIAILGGTFDPIHNGHLRPVLELLEDLDLAEVRFIPASQPPHRNQPLANQEQRLAMLRLAIAEQPGFVLDERELSREGPSYMVDTLHALRSEMGDRPLCLVLGMDAFEGLPKWHRWREIPDLVHLLIIHRPGGGLSLSEVLVELLGERKLHHAGALRERPAGGILFHPVTQLDISASRIREILAQRRSPRYLLPEQVWSYIGEQGLYRSP